MVLYSMLLVVVFFFKQKTAYEMRISDWSSDVCSSDLPSSLRAGLELLAQLPGRRWLVLGNMAELGSAAAQLHADAGSTAKRLGIERLFAVGPFAGEAVSAFGDGAERFDCNEHLAVALAPQLDRTITFLVKGSRSARMEPVVAVLTGESSPR